MAKNDTQPFPKELLDQLLAGPSLLAPTIRLFGRC
jgi:hypothetical protein